MSSQSESTPIKGGGDNDKRNRNIAIVVVVIILLALIIGLAVGLTVGQDDSSSTCTPLVLVYYATPNVVYNGILNRVTVYVSGLNDSDASEVQLVGGSTRTLPWAYASNSSRGVIIASIPMGTPADQYRVRVTNQDGCRGDFLYLEVVETANLQISSVSPNYIWTEVSTSISVQLSSGAFEATPVVYLSSTDENDNTTYVLTAVVFISSSNIDITLPAGLAIGQYDLIIVNPNGDIAVELGGLYVTVNAPPTIRGANPSSLVRSGSGQVSFFGGGLLNATNANLTCYAGPGLTGTATTVAATTVTPISDSQLDVTFPVGGLDTGKLCIALIVFESGQIYRYATMSVSSASGNPPSFVEQIPRFNMSRRAPMVVTGAPLASTRVVYVVGGDNGTDETGIPTMNNPIRTIEASQINEDGSIKNFTTLDSQLPKPCAFGGAVTISSMIYVICGYDGEDNQPSTLSYRAQVLNPLLVPSVAVDLNIYDDEASNLTEGTWYYTVSAVFDEFDANNPGGESLSGATITLQLPDLDGMEVVLSWDAQPDAVAYHVYRSPTANTPVTDLWLIATTNETSFSDMGAEPISTRKPLIPYSLGNWAELPPLNVARHKFGIVVSQSAVDTSQYTIFVFGGADANGNPIGTYESLTVTVVEPVDSRSPETQNVGTWEVGTATLNPPRHSIGAVITDKYDNSAITNNDQWIYIGAGIIDNVGTISTDQEAAMVTSDPTQLSFYSSNLAKFPAGGFAGYCYGKANDFVFATAGKGGTATPQSSGAEFCDAAQGAACQTVPPDLKTFNSFGSSLPSGRIFPSCVQTQVFIFMGGGIDGSSSTPLDSVLSTFCCG